MRMLGKLFVHGVSMLAVAVMLVLSPKAKVIGFQLKSG